LAAYAIHRPSGENVALKGSFDRTLPNGDSLLPSSVSTPDGKSIFYIPAAASSTVSVPITTRPAVTFGAPVELPRTPKPSLLSHEVRGYDVLPDGRFISVVPASEDGSAPITEFRVVLTLV
jgi:hypothetical protein